MASWDDPHSRHAMLVHWPIVLVPVGAVLLVWFLVGGCKRRSVALAARLAFAGAMVGAGLAAGAGEEAYERVEASVPALTAEEDNALEAHEELGEGAWLWPAGCAVLCGLALLPKPKRTGLVFGLLALGGALVVSGRFAWTAHTGGVLVYDHGLGVPARGSASGPVGLPAEAAPEREHGREEHDDDD